MIRKLLTGLVFILTLSSGVLSQSETVHPKLKPFAKFVGQTWVTDQSDFKDIQHWSWQHDGQVIMIQHRVNDGAYSGTAVINYDQDQDQVIYRYVTSAGFYTNGVLSPGPKNAQTSHSNSYSAFEVVKGDVGDIQEVKSGGTLDGDTLTVWSQMKIDGIWSDKQIVVYSRQ